MQTIQQILLTIQELLAAQTKLSDIDVLLAYPKGFRQTPLTRPVVTVGLSSIVLEPGAFSGYCGEDAETGQQIYARRAVLQLKLGIYIPQLSQGLDTLELFTRITDQLLGAQMEASLLEISSTETAWDQQATAYFLPVTLKLRALLGTAQEAEQAFSQIIVKPNSMNAGG